MVARPKYQVPEGNAGDYFSLYFLKANLSSNINSRMKPAHHLVNVWIQQDYSQTVFLRIWVGLADLLVLLEICLLAYDCVLFTCLKSVLTCLKYLVYMFPTKSLKIWCVILGLSVIKRLFPLPSYNSTGPVTQIHILCTMTLVLCAWFNQ